MSGESQFRLRPDEGNLARRAFSGYGRGSAVKITPVGNQLAARESLLRGSLQGNLIAQVL